MTGVSNTINKIVNFLTSPFESGKEDEGLFTELGEEFAADYGTDRNAALEPAFKTPYQREERKVVPISGHGRFSGPSRNYDTASSGYEVVVFEPRSYSESTTQIAEALKEKKTVILNLQLLDKEQSQRVVDFLCGCTYALEGDQKRIGDRVFIFTPDNINLSQETVSSKLSREAYWSTPQTNQN